MPTFDYRCPDCSYTFECMVLHKDELPICPDCGKHNATQVWLPGGTPGIPAPEFRPYDLLDRCIPEEPKQFPMPKKEFKKGETKD